MSKYFIEFSLFLFLILFAINYVLITEFILPADDRLATHQRQAASAQEVGRAANPAKYYCALL